MFDENRSELDLGVKLRSLISDCLVSFSDEWSWFGKIRKGSDSYPIKLLDNSHGSWATLSSNKNSYYLSKIKRILLKQESVMRKVQ